MPDPYISIQNSMTEDARAAAMAQALRMNPQLQGAHLADVLEMYYENDGMLTISEPFWEHHGDELIKNVPAHYVSVAVLAVGLLLRQPDGLDAHAVLTVELLAWRAATLDRALRIPELSMEQVIGPDVEELPSEGGGVADHG